MHHCIVSLRAEAFYSITRNIHEVKETTRTFDSLIYFTDLLDNWLNRNAVYFYKEAILSMPRANETRPLAPTRSVFYVKTLTKKTYEIPVSNWVEETISDIKHKIENISGIPQDQQGLIFAGRVMEDEKTVSECNLSKESTLHLVLRIR